MIPNPYLQWVQWASKKLIYERKINLYILNTYLHKHKINLFLEWSIQHKWMKNWEESY